VYVPIMDHSNSTLNMTTSAAATWKIPSASRFGECAVLLDMTELGTPTSAVFVVVYTSNATGTNQIGLSLAATPQPAGTTVTPIASSVVTLANSSSYPQTVEKDLTISDLGTSKVWIQFALDLNSNGTGPNVRQAALILYYN